MKIKKIFLLMVIFYFMFFLQVYATQSGTVNVKAVRLRQDATTSSSVLTTIYNGEKVEILEETGEWYKVEYSNKTGYLMKKYVTVSNGDLVQNNVNENLSTYDTNLSTGDLSKITTTANVKFYYLPSLLSTEFYQVDVNKELTVISQIGNWVKVTDNNMTGWVIKSKTNMDASTTLADVSSIENNKEINNSVINNTIENTILNNTVIENSTNLIKNDLTNVTSNSTSNNESSNIINAKAKVIVETAKVRESASSSGNIIGFLDLNDEITIESQEGDWYKFTSSGINGYVNSSLVKIVDPTVTSRSLDESRLEEVKEQGESAVQNKGEEVVNFAKQFLGYSYVSGGKTPASGFDCSGFTKYVFSNFGYTLGATAKSQVNFGVNVERENLLKGDLLIFNNEANNDIGHVGIYIGDNQFIHAANPSRGVVIDNLNTNSYYNTRFVCARRIVN